MGATVCDAVEAADGLELSGRADPALGVELGDVLEGAEVVVDFTVPDQALPNAHKCLHAGVSVIVGTTGFDLEKLRKCAADHWNGGEGGRAFVAPNFAIGAVLMMRFVVDAAIHLPDVEIVEYHHPDKRDAPSGTAVATAQRIADARGGEVADVPIHSVRLHGVVANQEVIFGGTGQTLTIRHDTTDRTAFMPGVLIAVKAVVGRPRGLTVGLDALLEA